MESPRREVERVSGNRATACTPDQLDSAEALLVDLYATAARHGVTRDMLSFVTSFANAAVDAVQIRDRRLGQAAG